MADSSTRADGAGSPPWTPRKTVAGGTISAGDRVGRSVYSEKLRRFVPGDQAMGEAQESVMEDFRVRERAPGRWIADTDTDEGN